MAQPLLFETLPLGRHLAVLTRLYYGALTLELSDLGIDRYYSVLMYIDRSEHPVTQQMVGEFLHMDKTSMVRVIDFLVEKGYVKRVTNPNDRRSYIIELTEQGHEILPKIIQAVAQLNDQVMEGLSEEERAQFHHTLCHISTRLKKMPAKDIQIDFQPNPNNFPQ